MMIATGGCCCGASECDECCFSDPGITIVADFGVGGWTAAGCAGGTCAGVAGEFSLSRTAPGVLGTECGWQLLDTSLNCGIGGLFTTFNLTIQKDGSECYWFLTAGVPGGIGINDTVAQYESARWTDGSCTLPATLTKVYDDGGGPSPACNGALPGTATIDVP